MGASEVTEEKIDAEVRKLVDEAYNTCKETLLANRKLLDEVTKTLVEEETIGNDQLKELVKEYRAAIPESALPAASSLETQLAAPSSTATAHSPAANHPTRMS